jgi:hypothetical protein
MPTPRIKVKRVLQDAAHKARQRVTPKERKKRSDAPAIGSIGWYLKDKRARQALIVIFKSLDDRHSSRLLSDFASDRPGPLTWYVIHMAFLESVSSPVRPLPLHPDLGDWLLALPDDQHGYHPADPCWQCGYNYPFRYAPDVSFVENHGRQSVDLFRSSLPAKPAPIYHSTGLAEPPPHPWVGRRCLYCGGIIVNHLEWLDPNGSRTLADFQNAPYRLKQQTLAAEWRRELDAIQVPPEWEL